MEIRIGSIEARIDGHDREIRDIKRDHKDEVLAIKTSVASLEESVNDIANIMRSIKYIVIGAVLYASIKEIGLLGVLKTSILGM